MEDRAYSGPPASQLILLSNLRTISPGQKVRFLGCVTRFSRKEIPATINLVHDHPPGHGLEVSVDIDLLLTTLKSSDVQQGEWVHVIGYVKDRPFSTKTKSSKAVTSQVAVQAIVLWSAGSFRLDNYEKSLDASSAHDSKSE
ncbi:telomere length regulation ten1 [Phlyctema vagabunda]|uniref:Telomere length regulation ten1 n=1 Tax=Phlyctema vagabunda TaxID=108571 RepID=A0ABR4PN35_9HELO